VATLPENPSLDHLRRQARTLQRAVRAGDAEAVALVRRYGGAIDPFPLSTAQFVVAREYGFASWPRLKHHVDVVTAYRWDPDAPSVTDLAGRFGRLACLTYASDGPEHWAEAARLLAEHPELTRDVRAAAAAADDRAVGALLAADPDLARRRGGPNGWTPLFHLVYSRLDAPRDAVLRTARLLLDSGADPNEGYLWRGLPTPFTLLTGVFGDGEQGPERTPPHPYAPELARLLLDAGADPNDGQTLYNRMFRPDDSHLRLLFAYGLGTGDGGPWKARLGEALDSPAAMLRGQLRWAAGHGFLGRVRLLAAHGVDVRSPFPDGFTPAELAARDGYPEITRHLVAQGAAAPRLTPVDAFVAAALSGDRTALAGLPVEDARRERPGLIVWAAASGRTEAIALLAGLGFDVNAKGRRDSPVEQEWETALHHAALAGDLEQARLLLSLGADPNIRDTRFDATPLDWARHFDQEAMVALLAPLTSVSGRASSGLRSGGSEATRATREDDA
jgi:hypothetical protein